MLTKALTLLRWENAEVGKHMVRNRVQRIVERAGLPEGGMWRYGQRWILLRCLYSLGSFIQGGRNIENSGTRSPRCGMKITGGL